METIVRSRVKETECKPSKGHGLPQSKVKLVRIPGNRSVKIRHANGCVIDLQGSERARGVWCVSSCFPHLFLPVSLIYSALVLSHERMASTSSALRSRGNQWPDGRLVTERSWHVLRMGSPRRLWVMSQSPSKSPLTKSTGWRSRPPSGAAVGVGDVGAIVQVPGVARSETGNAERFDQGVEVGGGPECWIGRHRRCLMRRTKPTPVAR